MRLADVCTIQMGYSARERLVETAIGVPAIQLSDLSQNDDLIDMEPYSVNLVRDKIKHRYFASGGDVVFRSRGRDTTAALLPEDWPHLAVIVMPLLILKPDTARIRPDYLAWAINAPQAQLYFDKNKQGQRISMISRAVLENLPMPLPNLATQKTCVELSRLSNQEHELEYRLADLRRHKTHLHLTTALSAASATNKSTHAPKGARHDG